MKRHGNLHSKIWHIKNILLGEKKARKGKNNSYGVKEHDKSRGCNLITLQNQLMSLDFKTSEYTTFLIKEPKEREIFRLPFFPDRICHHAIMNVLEKIWVDTFTRDTYGCVKRRGIHGALRQLKKNLKNKEETTYCLKLDIQKFYPSVDHNILKTIIRKKIKDNNLLILLDNIIDSASGIPIGNYLSQYFGNVYLNVFDHWIKQIKNVKFYYRYVDDIVILNSSKENLKNLFVHVKEFFGKILNLKIKSNYQIFPVIDRGIDFVGYKFYHTHVLLRKKIKKSFAKAVKNKKIKSLPSYKGWAKHCNSKNLIKKLNKFNEIPKTLYTSSYC
jgi:hypothetical protein